MQRRNGILSALALAAVAALAAAAPASPPADDGIPAGEVGLCKVGVNQVPSPPRVEANGSEPGDLPLVERAYPGIPPVVPHGILEYVPITRDDNACLDCHEVETKEPGEPTPIPRSHYVDLRNAPETVRDEVAGARYNCVACHVAETDAPLLVESVFGTKTPMEDAK